MSNSTANKANRNLLILILICLFIIIFNFNVSFDFTGSLNINRKLKDNNYIHFNNNKKLNDNISIKIDKPQSHSCLNDIYDKIFIISIPSRINTLSISLSQLDNENISYIVWEGHSKLYNHSVSLWNTFRLNFDNKTNTTNHRYRYKISAYDNPNIFFLRQTQMNIIQNSLINNYTKILIFEDDILISNPYWIQLFCENEPNIDWNILTLGQNEFKPWMIKLRHIRTGQDNYKPNRMQYYFRKPFSYGAFAISIRYSVYKIILDTFMNKLTIKSLDNSFNLFPKNVRYLFKGINPPLILPDVRSSTLRKKENNLAQMYKFIGKHLIDKNMSHFSKYWDLRFNNNSNYSVNNNKYFKQYSFDNLVMDSPSNLYLHKSNRRK